MVAIGKLVSIWEQEHEDEHALKQEHEQEHAQSQ